MIQEKHTNAIGFGSEHRKTNEQQERWVATYLDTYFYPHISRDFKRVTDNELQKKGIDLLLTGGTRAISIDEKASVEWCNVGLNKYSMELSLLTIDKATGTQKEVNGWYMANCISSHIAIVFIDSATTVNDRYLTGSGITEATVVIINKQTFQKALDKIGWTRENLKKKNDQIRTAFKEYGVEYWKHVYCGSLRDNGVHFIIQDKEKQKEHGISVQFTRQFLIDNSDFAAHVTKEKITKLNQRKSA